MNKVKRIIEYYQPRHQLKKLSEEVYELQEAVLDLWNIELRTQYDEDVAGGALLKKMYKEHLEEEFADVLVLLEQFKVYYDLDYSVVLNVMKRKVDRQSERINKEIKYGSINNY